MNEIEYDGLGFSVRLKNVKTRTFRGEVLPDINHRELEDSVFSTLLWMPAHLSGAHLSFIRGYMKLSQKKMATILDLNTHSTISGWESKLDQASGMPGPTEVVIRLLMADFIKDEEFASHFREFLSIKGPPALLELRVA